MSRREIAVSIDQRVLNRLDRLIGEGKLPGRDQAIENAIAEKLEALEEDSFTRECRKLDPEFEKMLAEEGMAEDFRSWPEY
jgi:metal-responsive CopG/Arc/MetJ family transcriptional regulator